MRKKLLLIRLHASIIESLSPTKFLVLLCCVGLSAIVAAHGQDRSTLRLVQTISLPGVSGRLDHMAVDEEKRRLFVAAVTRSSRLGRRQSYQHDFRHQGCSGRTVSWRRFQ